MNKYELSPTYKAVCTETGQLLAMFDLQFASGYFESYCRVYQSVGFRDKLKNMLFLGDVVLVGANIMTLELELETGCPQMICDFPGNQLEKDYFGDHLIYFFDEATPDIVLGNIHHPKETIQKRADVYTRIHSEHGAEFLQGFSEHGDQDLYLWARENKLV